MNILLVLSLLVMRVEHIRSKKAEVLRLASVDPPLTPKEIAEQVGTTRSYVYQTLKASDHPMRPDLARICRLEARVKTLEELFAKFLQARKLSYRPQG